MKTNCLIEILEEKEYVKVKKCERGESTGRAGFFVEKYLRIETKFRSVYDKIIESASNDEDTLLTSHRRSGKTFYVFIRQNEEAYNYIARRSFIMNSIIDINGLEKLNKMVKPNYIVKPYTNRQHRVIDVLEEKKRIEKEKMEKEFEEEVNNFINSLP